MKIYQGEFPFAINDNRGEKVLGRGFMITGGVLMLPSMPKGEIFYQ